MDIDLLSKMIGELILDRDEVALPGLGCFVAEVVPSSFSDKGYTINPPYRRLVFRQRSCEDDTVLSDFYASSNGIAPLAAAVIIKDFLSELRGVLKQRKTVVFPQLGRLRATRENNFFFVADENLEIYPSGFGLESVSLKTHQETAEEVSEAIEGLAAMVDLPVAEPAPEHSPEPTAEPLESEPATEPKPAVEEPAAESNSVADSEPAAEDPAAEPEPIAGTQPVVTTSAPAPFPAPSPLPTPSASARKRPMPTAAKVTLWTVGLILAAALAFMALSRLDPTFIDRLLYSPEELELLR